ncbi:Uncharacterized protein encoded in toxicity protection region of plasmid R478, contains von Willebrand factor (vWF) domain [Mycobacteroides abscessus subsp. abscessus]|nr:Uncharacterized protein encoded in toxicity protection region of plasmid R478, contains von Willebrand factor (vWF) domain [Mycobacteroides abscessus subsp. abscessus]
MGPPGSDLECELSNYYIESDAGTRTPAEEATRELLVLLLDCSGSLGPDRSDKSAPPPIDELNAAVEHFMQTSIHAVPTLDTCGEIAIGIFRGEDVHWLELSGDATNHPFYYINDQRSFPAQKAWGRTPLTEAVLAARQVVQTRKNAMRADGIIHGHRPNIFLVTDGLPSTSWVHLPDILRKDERDKKFLFWILGTHGANDQVLGKIAAPKAYLPLKGVSIAEVIDFLSRSLGVLENSGSEREASEYYEQIHKMAEDIVRRHNEILG